MNRDEPSTADQLSAYLDTLDSAVDTRDSALDSALGDTADGDGPDHAVDPEAVHTAYQLLVGECAVGELSRLRSGDLTRLLLEVYPQARPDDDPNEAVDAVDVLVDFAFDAGHIDEQLHAELLEELDAAETALLGSLDVPRIAGDEPNLKELFNLPDRLGPIRLPAESDLAEVARRSTLLATTRAFAERILDGADQAGAAEAAGVSDEDLPTISALASELGFLTFDADEPDDADDVDDPEAGDDAETDESAPEPACGPTLDEWPGGDDEDVLTVWGHALNWLLAWSLPSDADRAGEETLDFTGTSAWFAPLFMTWRVGLPVAAISDMMADIAGDDLTADQARAAWSAWSAEHGDPAEVLLGRLASHGAVEVTHSEAAGGPLARITDLGAASLRGELIESDVDVPLLPDPEDVTAADLVEVLLHGLDGELEAEAPAWFEARTPEAAADALLAEAAQGDAAHRAGAIALVREYTGVEAEPAWRRAMDLPNVSLHARNELAALHEADTDLDDAEIGWLLVDTIAGQLPRDRQPDEAEQLTGLLTRLISTDTAAVVETMWRAEHPEVLDVLTALGELHPDKAIAKAARKAGRKAADRAGA